MLTTAEEIIKDVKIGGSLDYSDYDLVEFVILRRMGLPKKQGQDSEHQERKLQSIIRNY